MKGRSSLVVVVLFAASASRSLANIHSQSEPHHQEDLSDVLLNKEAVEQDVRLSAEGGSCRVAKHGNAIVCERTTSKGNHIKYTTSFCSSEQNNDGSDECLIDTKKTCYQLNNKPCIASSFCEEGKLEVNCSNLFASTTGASCGVAKCDGSCEVQSHLLDYNEHSSHATNGCWTVGAVNKPNSQEWTHVLSEGTEIQVTVLKNGAHDACLVELVDGDNKKACPCSVTVDNISDGEDFFTAVSYDCSAYSNDRCAVMNQGKCGTHRSSVRAPVSTTVSRQAQAPPSLYAAACAKYPGCYSLGGLCCPAANGVYNPCCDASAPTPAGPTAPIPTSAGQAEPTPPPVMPPMSAPVTAPVVAPVGTSASDMCSDNPGCGNLNGKCCPTIDGIFLDCCGNNTAPTPVMAPVMSPMVTPEAMPVMTPVAAPTAPHGFPINYAAACANFEGCRTLGGFCCPAANGVFNPCCDQGAPMSAPVPTPVAAPVPAPVMAPVTAPVAAPVPTSNGQGVPTTPSGPQPAGFPINYAAACANFEGCRTLGGFCCPAANGVFNPCCDQGAPMSAPVPAPVMAPVTAPVTAPVAAPVPTSNGQGIPTTPSGPQPAGFPINYAAACANFEGCRTLGGFCCPAANGVFNPCCDQGAPMSSPVAPPVSAPVPTSPGQAEPTASSPSHLVVAGYPVSIEAACAYHEGCKTLGGFCCPAANGVFNPCCGSSNSVTAKDAVSAAKQSFGVALVLTSSIFAFVFL